MGFPDAKWAVDQVVSKVGVQPNNMRKFKVYVINGTTLGLKFLEPLDSYYSEGGALAAVTKGVLIRMSTDGYPQDINDGTLVVDNTDLGAYEDTPFEVDNLVEGTNYYFTAFPYSNVGVYNESGNVANKDVSFPTSLETVNVNVTIDNTKRFTSADVKLVNVDTGVEVSHTLTQPGTVTFEVEAAQTCKVTVSNITTYKIASVETEQFVTVAGGKRTFDFNYELGFLYTITFDNGADGIPASYEYSDDCQGFAPALVSAMNGWNNSPILDKFKPCVIKPNAVQPEYYLKKDDIRYKADGVTASVLTGADGDVMVEVENMYYSIVSNTDGTITLSISETKIDDTYHSFLEVAGVEQLACYRAIFSAYTQNGVMRSVSGVAPTTNQARAVFRTQARARGAEYSQNDYYLVFLWECMYLMLYGSRASQSVLGRGRTLSSNTAGINTGTMNDKPFCWGDQTGTNGVKFLGIENFYGDRWEFVDGLTIVNYIPHITCDTSKYDDVGANCEIIGNAIPSSASSAYIKKMQVGKCLMLPIEIGGSETTYYCDALWSNSGTGVARFGGRWADMGSAGAFCWSFDQGASNAGADVGSRLCRKISA